VAQRCSRLRRTHSAERHARRIGGLILSSTTSPLQNTDGRAGSPDPARHAAAGRERRCRSPRRLAGGGSISGDTAARDRPAVVLDPARSGSLLLRRQSVACELNVIASPGRYVPSDPTTGRRARTRSSETSWSTAWWSSAFISEGKRPRPTTSAAGRRPSRPIRAGPVTNALTGARGLRWCTSSRRCHEHPGRGGVRHEGVRGREQGGPAVEGGGVAR
jgi:hypothetical protein